MRYAGDDNQHVYRTQSISRVVHLGGQGTVLVKEGNRLLATPVHKQLQNNLC